MDIEAHRKITVNVDGKAKIILDVDGKTGVVRRSRKRKTRRRANGLASALSQASNVAAEKIPASAAPSDTSEVAPSRIEARPEAPADARMMDTPPENAGVVDWQIVRTSELLEPGEPAEAELAVPAPAEEVSADPHCGEMTLECAPKADEPEVEPASAAQELGSVPGVVDAPASEELIAEHEPADALGTDRIEVTADSSPEQQVLIIDDDPVMRMLLGIGLRSQGYECLAAENGKAAQELVLQSRVDVIVVDLMMPVMDGLAFIEWLRGPAQSTTPAVALTNLNDPKISDRALALGATDVVAKPVQLQELISAIRKSVPARPVL